MAGDRSDAGIVSPMVPLAVSGKLVIAVAVIGAIVLFVIVMRIENWGGDDD
jgi:hypothetical protein